MARGHGARGLAVMGCLPVTACGDFSGGCGWLGEVSRGGGPWGGGRARLVRGLPTGFVRCCQRAFEPANEPSSMATNEPSSPPQRRFVWDATTAAVRSPSRASAPLPLRFRSARAPLGALGEGLRGGEDNQADTNKKPDLVAKNVTRSGMQISPVERRSTFWAIDIQRTGSRTNKSSPEGRNPCTWCNIDHPVSGLCEHGRSCGIWHQLASWLTSFLQVSIKLAHLDEHVP